MFCGMGHLPDCTCGLCRTVAKGYVIPLSRTACNHRRKYRGSEMAFHKDRPRPDERFGKLEDPFSDDGFVKEYPSIYAYLFEGKWKDGTPRHTSTLLMFFEGPVFKAVLNDRDQNRSAFFTSSTFAGLFDSIEVALTADNVDWRNRTQKTPNGMNPPW